jgi:2-polyprenyl-6-methoxyphenol hydroxylase-like FAD-dependent oxidoreductase
MRTEQPKSEQARASLLGDKPRILIVGAGIAGLTLAAGLARQGITPAIAEIADGLLTRGLGLFLTSNVFLARRCPSEC